MILRNLTSAIAKLLTLSWGLASTSSLLIPITETFALTPSFVSGQSQSPAPLGNENSVVYAYPDPPENGVPPSVPAGPRGPCPAIEPALTALVPFVPSQPGNSETGAAWGLTTQERPTFWAYVPYGPDTIQSGEISIREGEGEREVATADLDLTSTPGIIEIPLPSTVSLEMNKWYKVEFFVDVYCSPNTRAQTDNVQVWVRRQDVNSTVRDELSQASTPLQRAIVYAENGFWYDALAAVVELRRNDPNDRSWETLLRSVKLDAIVSQPLRE